MKIPHPIVGLVWRLASTNRRLRAELDEAKADAAVSKCREKRWRALAVASKDPALAEEIAYRAASDDWADAPEIAPHQRNAAPRSAP